MLPGRDRACEAGLDAANDVAVLRWGDAEGPLERADGKRDSGRKLRSLLAGIDLQVADLALRKILPQRAGFELSWIIEIGAPVQRGQLQELHAEHIALPGAGDPDGTDDGVRPLPGFSRRHCASCCTATPGCMRFMKCVQVF